jgi:type I site-specific restriction-modification system R (restriction) subunit
MQRIYFRLNWREYFKVSNEQLTKYNDNNNGVVYKKIYTGIKSALSKNLNEHLIAIDPSSRTVMAIPKEDYDEVLELCQTNLEKKEEYESCAEIRDTLIKLRNKKKRQDKKTAERLLLIKME